MNESVILAIVGAIQAVTLGYLETLRRGQRSIISKCDNRNCRDTITKVLKEERK